MHYLPTELCITMYSFFSWNGGFVRKDDAHKCTGQVLFRGAEVSCPKFFPLLARKLSGFARILPGFWPKISYFKDRGGGGAAPLLKGRTPMTMHDLSAVFCLFVLRHICSEKTWYVPCLVIWEKRSAVQGRWQNIANNVVLGASEKYIHFRVSKADIYVCSRILAKRWQLLFSRSVASVRSHCYGWDPDFHIEALAWLHLGASPAVLKPIEVSGGSAPRSSWGLRNCKA